MILEKLKKSNNNLIHIYVLNVLNSFAKRKNIVLFSTLEFFIIFLKLLTFFRFETSF